MTGQNINTESFSSLARTAGWLYLIIIVCGIGSEVFIRSSLIVDGDAAATASNIVASDSLFRLGFVADSIMLLSDVAIAVLFYVLLKPVSNTLALMAAAFRLTQASILGFNLLNYYAAALLLNGSVYVGGFETAQLNAMASLFLELHSHGYDLGLLFFGLSNLILGYLVIKADYFPSLLGYGLIAAAVVYLAGSFTRFAFPDYASMMEPVYVIPLIAELGFAIYLLVKGVKNQS
ncbi:DUF4386 domain-containing protein [Thiomicrorhabdus sp. ZW0627]|uniref:DUF4386 domain-containing protein n=1 Tax=Thiomicrorhabdus sp. ZW0627 TaxID=3039774 RepID=UPI00243714AC|nr:DUF4386 domain-containing protein [Thiomicrorhabdus sp. ZW0627]MDG6772868.1 DUF4386 domain-containing protein [Thiomicrorhabdus sp. ZW0627]